MINKLNWRKWLPRRAVTNAMLYAGSNYWESFGSLLANLVSRNLITPIAFGANAFARSIYAYLAIAHALQRNTIIREIPEANAKGTIGREKGYEFLYTTFTFLGILTFLESGAFILVGLLNDEPYTRLAFLVLGLTGALDAFAVAYRIGLNAYTRFDLLSKASLVSGFISPVLIIGLSYWKGTVGFFLGLGLSAVFKFILYGLALRRVLPTLFKLRLDFGVLKQIIQVGGGIQIPSIVIQGLLSLTQLRVGVILGFEALGYYSLAIAAYTTIDMLGQSLLSSYFPTFVSRLVSDPTEIVIDLVDRINTMSVLILTLVLGLAILIIPPGVHLFLPRYVSITLVMQILMLTAFCSGMSQLPTFIHFGYKRFRGLHLDAALMGVITTVSLLLFTDQGLVVVSLCLLFGFVLYSVATYISAGQMLPLARMLFKAAIGFCVLTSMVLASAFNHVMVAYAIYGICILCSVYLIVATNKLKRMLWSV